MRTWIKLGTRNLWKNRRRSAITIGAIALGFAAVNIFGGFTAYVFTGLEEGHVNAYANGHLGVFRKGFLDEGTVNPAKYLLTPEDIDLVRQICARDPRIVVVTPWLQLTGLISNGEISTIFVGTGRVAADTEKMRARARSFVGSLRMYEGRSLTDGTPHGIGLSEGLAQKLDLDLGGNPVVVAPTVEGHMNALDAEVFQLFGSPYDILDDKLIHVPLGFARDLVDTDGADGLALLLETADQVPSVMSNLEQQFSAQGLDVEIRTWQELSTSYMSIRNMLNVMFGLLFTIVFVIVVLGVINTITMAVLERTREIGTLRALGLKRRGALAMFAVESGLLGLLGCAAGFVLTVAVWYGIRLAAPQWTPPMIARPVPLEFYLVPQYLLVSMLFLVALAMFVAVVPAQRAARMSIIDALGHV